LCVAAVEGCRIGITCQRPNISLYHCVGQRESCTTANSSVTPTLLVILDCCPVAS